MPLRLKRGEGTTEKMDEQVDLEGEEKKGKGYSKAEEKDDKDGATDKEDVDTADIHKRKKAQPRKKMMRMSRSKLTQKARREPLTFKMKERKLKRV